MRLTLLLLLFISTNALPAQDVIHLLTGEEIEAKVLEVGEEVRYKSTDFLDGPVYVLHRAEILMITYSNGREELFNVEVAKHSNSFKVRDNYLRVRGMNRYYEGYRLISKDEFEAKLQTHPEVYKNFQDGRSLQNTGYGIAGGGILIGFIGAGRSFRSTVNATNSFLEPQGPRTGLLWTGMGIAIVGTVITGIGGQKKNNAIAAYNIKVGQDLGMKINWNSNGVGLVLQF